MRTPLSLATAIACGACGSSTPPAPTPPVVIAPAAPGALLGPDAFAAIADPTTRSAAMFTELGRVLLSPRCVNCHPADDSPRQGDASLRHDPPVTRGPDDRGVPGMECATCHQDRNLDHARVPGAPGWHLAPISMAWQGRRLDEICAQLKDPAKNGGKDLAALQVHIASDPLVGWAWEPGADRVPAPGTQRELGALAQAWIDTGAACPPAPEVTP
ncbi:MAG: Isoquinoline 1-oxidoreductase subunit [Kofleriaceae bacterium]